MPIFPPMVDPRAIVLTKHNDEVAQMMDALRNGADARGVSMSPKLLPKIIIRGEREAWQQLCTEISSTDY